MYNYTLKQILIDGLEDLNNGKFPHDLCKLSSEEIRTKLINAIAIIESLERIKNINPTLSLDLEVQLIAKETNIPYDVIINNIEEITKVQLAYDEFLDKVKKLST